MVALKPSRGPAQEIFREEKQERRGGIETAGQRTAILGDPVKQERRGGIETRRSARPTAAIQREAGTPWWH